MPHMLYWRIYQNLYTYLPIRMVGCRRLPCIRRHIHDGDDIKKLMQRLKNTENDTATPKSSKQKAIADVPKSSTHSTFNASNDTQAPAQTQSERVEPNRVDLNAMSVESRAKAFIALKEAEVVSSILKAIERKSKKNDGEDTINQESTKEVARDNNNVKFPASADSPVVCSGPTNKASSENDIQAEKIDLEPAKNVTEEPSKTQSTKVPIITNLRITSATQINSESKKPGEFSWNQNESSIKTNKDNTNKAGPRNPYEKVYDAVQKPNTKSQVEKKSRESKDLFVVRPKRSTEEINKESADKSFWNTKSQADWPPSDGNVTATKTVMPPMDEANKQTVGAIVAEVKSLIHASQSQSKKVSEPKNTTISLNNWLKNANSHRMKTDVFKAVKPKVRFESPKNIAPHTPLKGTVATLFEDSYKLPCKRNVSKSKKDIQDSNSKTKDFQTLDKVEQKVKAAGIVNSNLKPIVLPTKPEPALTKESSDLKPTATIAATINKSTSDKTSFLKADNLKPINDSNFYGSPLKSNIDLSGKPSHAGNVFVVKDGSAEEEIKSEGNVTPGYNINSMTNTISYQNQSVEKMSAREEEPKGIPEKQKSINVVIDESTKEKIKSQAFNVSYTLPVEITKIVRCAEPQTKSKSIEVKDTSEGENEAVVKSKKSPEAIADDIKPKESLTSSDLKKSTSEGIDRMAPNLLNTGTRKKPSTFMEYIYDLFRGRRTMATYCIAPSLTTDPPNRQLDAEATREESRMFFKDRNMIGDKPLNLPYDNQTKLQSLKATTQGGSKKCLENQKDELL